MAMTALEQESAYRHTYELILSCGPRLVYSADLPVMTGDALEGVYFAACVNEKAAYEMALAGAIAHKRTACLFSVEGVYEALDPLMSSAYTGVKGGFVVVCVKEGALDITPLGPFSKLPVLVSDGKGDDLPAALSFAFDLSERYEIPCVVETLPPMARRESAVGGALEGRSAFVKDQARWAAIPKFRYQLHKALNEKTERIREEFEHYSGNAWVRRGAQGVITHRACDEGMTSPGSVLALGSIFPLPTRLVSAFINEMEEVRIVEGAAPAIEVQVRESDKIDGALRKAEKGGLAIPSGREELFGFTVVRDRLGPASAINLAHGMAKGGAKKILAITREDAFFHSGLPALVNTLYNGSAYVLVIERANKGAEIGRVLQGFGFSSFFRIREAGELAQYADAEGLTVLSYEGDL